MQPLFQAIITVKIKYRLRIFDITPETFRKHSREQVALPIEHLSEEFWDIALHQKELLQVLLNNSTLRDQIIRIYVMNNLAYLAGKKQPLLFKGDPILDIEPINQIIKYLSPEGNGFFEEISEVGMLDENLRLFRSSFDIELINARIKQNRE